MIMQNTYKIDWKEIKIINKLIGKILEKLKGLQLMISLNSPNKMMTKMVEMALEEVVLETLPYYEFFTLNFN